MSDESGGHPEPCEYARRASWPEFAMRGHVPWRGQPAGHWRPNGVKPGRVNGAVAKRRMPRRGSAPATCFQRALTSAAHWRASYQCECNFVNGDERAWRAAVVRACWAAAQRADERA